MTQPAPKPPPRDRDPKLRAFVATWPCCICELHTGRPVPSFNDCAHVKTRAIAGDRDNVIPLCRPHHRELHTDGIVTFATRHGVSLERLARRYTRLYDRDNDTMDW